ncbi:hypothetical protein CHUAL_008844 [Chamberlinius hualienensis]
MKLVVCSLLLLAVIVKANVIPKKQSEDVMPMVYPIIQAENYNYSSGSTTKNDCGSTAVGNLRNGGMLRYDNVDIGVNPATRMRIRFSNKALGLLTTLRLYTEHPVTGALPIVSILAPRTNDWCDLAQTLPQTMAITLLGSYSSLYLTFTTTDPSSEGIDLDWFTFDP